MRISKLMMIGAAMAMVSSAAAFGVVGEVVKGTQTTDSDTLTIGGNVPQRVHIAVSAAAGAQSLDLMSDIQWTEIASVNERSNVRAGYEVSVSSANDWVLRGKYEDKDADTLAYQLRYDGVEKTLAEGPVVFTVATDRTNERGKAGIDKSLEIKYFAANDNLYDGDYEDTLTFTITAN